MSIFAVPINTVSTLTPGIIINSATLTPVISTRPYTNVYSTIYPYPSIITAPLYNTSIYYDGIGDNPFVEHKINTELRYKFLDKYLHEDYPDILRMLKSSGGEIIVLSSEEADKNDISKDTDKILEDKIDFIGSKILTYTKNKKILLSIINKNTGIKYYDLPHNVHYVKKEQAKYVKSKLKEMK